MFACSLPSLLGSCSAGPTDATRCCWEHTRPTSNPNPSHAAVQSRAGTQGRAASSRAPAQQRAPTAAGTARRGRSLRRGWPALLGKRRREPHLELLSAKPLPWAAPGCHGQEGKALSWRLPRAELPTTAACQGGRLSSARWAGVSSRSTLRGHKPWGSARRGAGSHGSVKPGQNCSADSCEQAESSAGTANVLIRHGLAKYQW